MITAGIDVGARYVKAAILEDGKRVLVTLVDRSGYDPLGAARKAFESALSEAGLSRSDVSYVVSTGFGRHRVDFRDANATDITAAAAGARFFYPNTRTVVDVGAGNTRTSKLDENGKVVQFRVTDKCAAGGGGFLERIAFYGGIDLSQLEELALKSQKPVMISTVCSVLAETEVINLVTKNIPMEDIMMGAVMSVAGRVVAPIKQVGLTPEVTLVGGMNMNAAFPLALERFLKVHVNTSRDLVFANAVGAAYLGYRRLQKRAVIAQ